MVVDGRLEVHVATERDWIREREDLGSPETSDAVLAVDPVVEVGEAGPTELAGGTPGRGIVVVDHEGISPRLGHSGEELRVVGEFFDDAGKRLYLHVPEAVLAHYVDHFLCQHPAVLTLPTVQDHADELHVVADGAVEAVPAHVLLRVRRQFEIRHGGQGPIVAALVHARPPGAHVIRHRERSIVHPERLEDTLLHYLAESLAPGSLDYLAHPVYVAPVLPLLARVEQKARRERCHRRCDDARDFPLLAVLHEIRVEEVVAEAGGVQHEMLYRNLGGWGAELRLTVGVEALEDVDVGDLGRVFSGGVVEGDHTLLHELLDCHARYGLGTREDGEHGVRGHLLLPTELALAFRALVEIRLAVGRHRDHAWNAIFPLHSTAQHAVRGFPDSTLHGPLFHAVKAAILVPVP